MIVAIHQPQYLPWLGYFDKIAAADCFILLDDVQFKRDEWQNRNRIHTPQGWQWLTVPVLHRFGQSIEGVQINNQVPWQKAHWKAITLNYAKTPFFKSYQKEFKAIYDQPWTHLSALNIALIQTIMHCLGIQTKIIVASSFDLKSKSTRRLVELCQRLKADTYFSGSDGPRYMQMSLFNEAQVNVVTQQFIHPQYPQYWSSRKNYPFVSHLSILDLLFNCGPQSFSILTAQTLQYEYSR